MTKRNRLIRGDDWTYRAGGIGKPERVHVLDFRGKPRRVEVEFVYRDNERDWVPAEHLEAHWNDLSAIERDRIVEACGLGGHQESDGELLTMALALLADFMPDEAWRLYKRYHRAASTAEWNVIGVFAWTSVRLKLGLPDKSPWRGIRD